MNVTTRKPIRQYKLLRFLRLKNISISRKSQKNVMFLISITSDKAIFRWKSSAGKRVYLIRTNKYENKQLLNNKTK